ncbi:ASCH domain-containing protein [Actinopolymorpha alba]|uniref:ASCH domain-containing protein n=1 Tax=Actinopolymorpha alba TaxID=533267 RepID=UPI000373F858|nr:ASCH domain-containing protein [Actinopolymorpha alba]
MKALTIQQPWAWAILRGGKTIENRTTAWKYRGPLAIHAGSRWSQRGEGDEQIIHALSRRPDEPCNYGRALSRPGHQAGEFTFNAILGTVQLVDVHPDTGCCRPWGMSEYDGKANLVHLVLEDPEPLAEPIPCKGRLGLWDLPVEALEGRAAL